MSYDISKDIALLVHYAERRGLLGEGDGIMAVNSLLDLLQLQEPYGGKLPEEEDEELTVILKRILDYAASRGLMPDDTTGYRDLMDARIMGLLMPRPSEVTRQFRALAEQQGAKAATDWFYRLCIDSNYIRMDRIRKNGYWLASTEYGELEITVNLSKPEKDPKEIALERNLPQSPYPKCLLCVENLGYAGRLNHPARQNHRVIPLCLDGETSYFQYSPYVYYNEHCIVFNGEHVPMRVDRSTFVRLLDFVSQFGHYFIGSNAELPIVGGSILSHDHYQGGRHSFPMERAPVEAGYRHDRYPGIAAGRIKWPMSVIRLAGPDQAPLIDLAEELLSAWRAYSDPTVDIQAFTEQDGSRTPHNTITPVARLNEKGQYELDLVLRNNRTTEEYPMGIFHPHEELHPIKKENIGVIEVMGLAVLPGRLLNELEGIKGFLIGTIVSHEAELEGMAPQHPLHKHVAWIRELLEKYGDRLSEEEADRIMKLEVGHKFMLVLSHAGVYKRDAAGVAAFDRFMEAAGFSRTGNA